jgi:ribosomal protein S21
VGARVVVRPGESVELALRRLRRSIEMWDRYPLYRPKPTKKRIDCFQKPAEVRHQRKSLAKTRQRQNLNYTLKELGLR